MSGAPCVGADHQTLAIGPEVSERKVSTFASDLDTVLKPVTIPVTDLNRKVIDKANDGPAPLGADLIESMVSFYVNPTDIVGRSKKLSELLEGIKNGHWEKPAVAIRKARESGDMALAERLKKALPAFTASGVFAPNRRKTNRVEPAGLLVIDIDGLENAEAVRDLLGKAPHVLAAFVSISGRGVKILVYVGSVDDDAAFKATWRAFAEYLKGTFQLEADPSGTDICRLCFLGYDPGIVINRGPIVPFTARAEIQNPSPSPSSDQATRPTDWDTAVVRSALAFISAACNRAEWLRVACAVKNALGEPGYIIFEQWSETCPEKFDADAARKLWDSLEAHKPGGVTAATLYKMAEERGWKRPVQPTPSSSSVIKVDQPDAIDGEIVTEPSAKKIFYDQNSKQFLALDSRNEWAPHNEASIKRILRQAGLDSRPQRGAALSDLETALVGIQTQFNIHFAGPVAGYKAGLYETPDTRFLVTKGPVIIAADPTRSWPLLKGILTGLLGEMQLVYFYGWLKIARAALVSGKFAPGQALAIAGPAESAKSLLQALITQMLGGRSARPYQFMAGQTSFNAHMFAAEHQMIEDESPATDFKARRTLGAMVKSVTVNSEQSCHRKNATPVMLKPFWRLSITVNDEPENLMVLPPLDESLEDKIILLKAERRPMPMNTSTPAGREAFWNALMAELPGLLAHVEAFEIPPELVSSRFGITHFHHPELLAKLDDLAPESKLLGYIDSVLFLGRQTWQGKAADIERILTDISCSYSYEARKLFSWPSACGTYLGRLRRRYPDRFVYAQTGEERDRIWTIHARNPGAASAASIPDLDLTGGEG